MPIAVQPKLVGQNMSELVRSLLAYQSQFVQLFIRMPRI